MREGAGIALAVAAVLVAFFATLAFVIVVLFWLFISGVALARSNDPAATSAPALLVGLVGIVTVLTVGAAATVQLVGKSLTPPSRRARRKAERPLEDRAEDR